MSTSTVEPAVAMVRSDDGRQAMPPPPPPKENDQSDFEKYVQRTAEMNGGREQTVPTRRPSFSSSIHRADSIFSFSRSSFSNQLSQLTSITLPQLSSLEASVSAIPNAATAVKHLIRSAEQMHVWIGKANNVLTGLNAEDDVEWAAAGGRDGLHAVDRAIARFESVVSVYVKLIGDVQKRPDIGDVDPDYLKKLALHMDTMLKEWARIKSSLGQVKEQVELAMEWQELWDNVLGEVGSELDQLRQLVFEMEEKRHLVDEDEQAAAPAEESFSGPDMGDLGTIAEEVPSDSNKRFSIGPRISSTSAACGGGAPAHNDSSLSDLTALFARMQPLRASLEFLPMRLSMFLSRAEEIFPGACEELEERHGQLEMGFKKLEEVAEAVRKELGEDRWVKVFHRASGQAFNMLESVEKSIGKVQEALETGAHVHNMAFLAKLIDQYEAQKQHYVAAIEQLISIIEKGLSGRLTVNGGILRSLSDMKARFDALKTSIGVMDSSLEDVDVNKAYQYVQDSGSSIVTGDSPVTASIGGTPGSSPASSDVMTPPGNGRAASRRASSVASATRSTMSKVKRYSGIPQMSAALSGKRSSLPRPSQGSVSRFSGSSRLASTPSSVRSTTPSSVYMSSTPVPAVRAQQRHRQSPSPMPARPRWSSSTSTNNLDTGHNFKSLARPPSMSTLSRSKTPMAAETAPSRPRSTARHSYSRDNLRSPMPPPTSKLPAFVRTSSLSPVCSDVHNATPRLSAPKTPRGRQSVSPLRKSMGSSDQLRPAHTPVAARPESSLGHSHSRRPSLLPTPKRQPRLAYSLVRDRGE